MASQSAPQVDPEIDAAYQNSAFIPAAEAYPPRWAAAAAAFRERLASAGRARLDLAYGSGERQRLDLFLPARRPAGLMVFFHGGYWRAFSKSDWSHFAAGALACGWAVAMPSYRLCPEVRLPAIIDDAAAALVRAAGEVAGPLVLAGHSAGGQMAARMLCADVALPEAVSARIRAAAPISGVYDLAPLLKTTMNADLRLDAEMARGQSPLYARHRRAVAVLPWVGSEERPAFIDQSRRFAEAWRVPLNVAPGRHHFDVIDLLQDPQGPYLARLLA